MKSPSETVEGPQAGKNFANIIGKLLSVSHHEIKRREEEYQRQAATNPKKRGPKRKSR